MNIKKNKGKVHPSPSSSSSNDTEVGVVLSVLSLLPTAILALASGLSLQDREVLAYMITRSSLPLDTSSSSSSKRKTTTATSSSKQQTTSHHHRRSKAPAFECECFDCYMSYWLRWDTSPNRDLIHRVIDAFEDHLNRPPRPPRGRRTRPQPRPVSSPEVAIAAHPVSVSDDNEDVVLDCTTSDTTVENDVVEEESGESETVDGESETVEAGGDDVAEIVRRVVVAAAVSEHKGLARKVLPDVLGLFNSRLWGLWSPNA